MRLFQDRPLSVQEYLVQWSKMSDLNTPPDAPKAPALPDELILVVGFLLISQSDKP